MFFGRLWPLSLPLISYASDSKASPGGLTKLYYLLAFSMRESKRVRESQLSDFTDWFMAQDSVNGAVWHTILGVLFVVYLYPQAVATVAIGKPF